MKAVWESVKAVIRGSIPDHSFRMWIEPIKFYQSDDGRFVVAAPNCFSKKRIQDNYSTLIQTQLEKEIGQKCIIDYVVAGRDANCPTDKQTTIQLALPNINVRPHNGRLLRKDYTFDDFVVGGNNDFAYTASLALASRKESLQNALFLLSKTGLGKSHLSQAIGHYVLSQSPEQRVFYMTAEDFSNEMIHAFRHDAFDQFKAKYRDGCDVLVLEDVQQLSGKERTQVELTTTLDSLYEANKKIIFSSCYLPGDIPKLNDKLRSRLSCSLISHIDPPNFRTRVRILEKKSLARGNQLPEDVLHYLASELTEDVRQLESGLIGVTAKASLLGATIDISLAQSVVKNIVRQRQNITIDSIKKLVCKHFNISINEIISRSRKQSIVRPRQIAMYLSRRYTDSPLQAIGRSFNRYHATALHSIGAIEQGLRDNGTIQKQVEILSQKLETGRF
jgi:chromosomal replication initiator protein